VQRKISSQKKLAQLQILLKLGSQCMHNTAKDTFPILLILLYIVILLFLFFYQMVQHTKTTLLAVLNYNLWGTATKFSITQRLCHLT
jgi:hypothetical protein